MKIGIIGAGNMGASTGAGWAAKGPTVCFSFTKDPAKLRSVAAAHDMAALQDEATTHLGHAY